MATEAPDEPWATRDPRAPLHLAMTFEGDALALGAGTRIGLAKRGMSLRKIRDEAFDEARVAALLAVVLGHEVAPPALRYICGALEKQSEGETALAQVYLALAGLPKLQRPAEAAWRLSAADGLMKGGMAPGAMLAALGIGPAATEPVERAYNPDQPRVPAGSGRESGQWTSENDAGDAPAEKPSSPHGVQIADNSMNWLQYANPVGTADATESGRPAFNGTAPNTQHGIGVQAAIADASANGFLIVSSDPVAVTVPGFPTPRVYDFLMQDPLTNDVIGVEVKTTLYDTIFLNPAQVEKDVALFEAGGAYSTALAIPVTEVAYAAYCFGCAAIDFRSAYLYARLLEAGIRIQFGSLPGASGRF